MSDLLNVYQSEVDYTIIWRNQFLEKVAGAAVALNVSFNLSDVTAYEFVVGVAEVAQLFAGREGRVDVLAMSDGHVCVNVYALDGIALVQAQILGPQKMVRRGKHHFSLSIAGLRDTVVRLRAALCEKYGEEHDQPVINWWFECGKERIEHRSMVMTKPPPVYDEFYPYLPFPVEEYLDRYMESESAILFMLGVPGTGKTSLARHFIFTRGMEATITYDDTLLRRDMIFVDFLFDDDPGCLLIEDADVMLRAREDDGNSMMSRFLNVSNGLVQSKNKKIIFTTNLGSFDTVDPALIRPGRCFDSIQFRALTAPEARRAAEVAGLPVPQGEGHRTLAELFNADQLGTPPVRRMGIR